MHLRSDITLQDDHWNNVSDPTDAPDCASGPIGGPTEMNVYCAEDMGLTQVSVQALLSSAITARLLLFFCCVC